MIPVLISGGSGKRLWPFSRTFYPKQFCSLFNEPLIISTAKRLRSFGAPILVTNQNFRALTEKTFGRYREAIRAALYEPLSKNTAPAIALLARYLEEKNLSHEVVGIFPCDHLIENEPELNRALMIAQTVARDQGSTVVIGIRPDFAATGYGYILTSGNSDPLAVSRFEEKPNAARAEELIKNKNCFWNSGIVISTGATLKKQFQTHQPKLWESISKLSFENGSNWKDIYQTFPDLSFDVGILEKLKTPDLFCVPCAPAWSDMGSWDAYTQKAARTTTANMIEFESKNISLVSQQAKVYAAIGLSDLTVVDTEDACLIFKKGDSEKLKNVVGKIFEVNTSVVDHAVDDVRPWGSYSVLQETTSTKVKCVQVDPGARLSYQSHQKREEHWIVSHGSGVVTLEEKEIVVTAGSYIKIPAKAKHRIANTGDTLLEFVEVQLGTYLGEDDIARFQDDYVRIGRDS